MFYVDYGTIGEVENKNVRFLHKRFSQDPIFANRGCLDRCKPNNGIWSLEAMEAFSQRLLEYFEIPMLAKVTNVNAEVRFFPFSWYRYSSILYIDDQFLI